MERKKTRSKQKNLRKDTRSEEVKAALGGEKPKQRKNRDLCYICLKAGHWARDCPEAKDKEEAKAADEEPEEMEGWGGDWAGGDKSEPADENEAPESVNTKKRDAENEELEEPVKKKKKKQEAAENEADQEGVEPVKKKKKKEKKEAAENEEVVEPVENEEPRKRKLVEGEGEPSAKKAKSTPITIFVGNLNKKATNDLIAKHFSVKPSKVTRNTRNTRLAFVKVFSQSDADAALKLHESELCGRTLRVEISKQVPKEKKEAKEKKEPKEQKEPKEKKEAKVKTDGESKKSEKSVYFVGQLHPDVTEEQLKTHFLTKIEEKDILSIRFLRDKATGAFKRIAFVDLTEGTDASALHQSSLCGRRIVVEPSGKNPEEARRKQKEKLAAEIDMYLNEFYATKMGKNLKQFFDDKLLEFIRTCSTPVIRSFLKEVKKLKEDELPSERSSAWLMGILRRHQSCSDSNAQYHRDERFVEGQ